MNSEEQLKAVIASYWRYVRQCPVIALEVSHNLSAYAEERADVLAVDKNRFLIETEVKVTLADLKRDAMKSKHRAFRESLPRVVARHFYFAVPKDIANKARPICTDLYPYAGVLGTNGTDEYGVVIYRQAKFLSGKRLTYPQVLRIIFNQSGTVCRLAKKVEELTRVQRNLEAQLKEYRDMERLER